MQPFVRQANADGDPLAKLGAARVTRIGVAERFRQAICLLFERCILPVRPVRTKDSEWHRRNSR
jgi:hypothetical protein